VKLVADKRFPSANADEHELRRLFSPSFSARVHVRQPLGHDAQGYSSVVLADAGRRPHDLLSPPARGLRSGTVVSHAHGG
jgi:hypothetical protein